jgi:hypothetical protein
MKAPAHARTSFAEALRSEASVRAAELRPPPASLDPASSLEAWIDFDLGVRRILDAGRYLLLTDDAVGEAEEESLRVLVTNLGPGADLSRVVPFLTLRHSLEYCLMFARRAHSHGFGAVTVTGGDSAAGVPRCLPRSRDLRARIRERVPGLALGAWANPFRDPGEQVDLLLDPDHHADYYVTQVVSHHDPGPIERFLDEAARRGLEMPGIVGVFHYRSANPRTLQRLNEFLPVPAEELTRDFGAGHSADAIASETMSFLVRSGVANLYLSNLSVREAARRLDRVDRLMDCPPPPERP